MYPLRFRGLRGELRYRTDHATDDTFINHESDQEVGNTAILHGDPKEKFGPPTSPRQPVFYKTWCCLSWDLASGSSGKKKDMKELLGLAVPLQGHRHPPLGPQPGLIGLAAPHMTDHVSH